MRKMIALISILLLLGIPPLNYAQSSFGGSAPSSAGMASGVIVMTLSACPAGYSEATALNGVMLRGTIAANGDVGQTGGTDTITPTVAALTAAAQAFTGSSANTSSVSGGTPAGTVAAPTITWPVGVPTFAGSPGTVPAQTFTGNAGTVPGEVISWPVGVPTFAGNALATHTHTLTPTGTNATVAVATTSGSKAGSSTGAFTAIAGAAAGSSFTVGAETFTGALDTSSAVSGGTPAGTIAWPAGVPTNATGSFTPAGTNGTAAFTPAGTIGWPAGVPANSAPSFSGNALAGHVHAVTATGTNSTSAVTGTLNSFDNRPAFVKAIFCQKN